MVSIQLEDSTLLDKIDHERKFFMRADSSPNFSSSASQVDEYESSGDPKKWTRGDVQAGRKEVNKYSMLVLHVC